MEYDNMTSEEKAIVDLEYQKFIEFYGTNKENYGTSAEDELDYFESIGKVK